MLLNVQHTPDRQVSASNYSGCREVIDGFPSREDSLLQVLKALMEVILFTCRKQDFLLEETNQFFHVIENLIEDNMQR